MVPTKVNGARQVCFQVSVSFYREPGCFSALDTFLVAFEFDDGAFVALGTRWILQKHEVHRRDDRQNYRDGYALVRLKHQFLRTEAADKRTMIRVCGVCIFDTPKTDLAKRRSMMGMRGCSPSAFRMPTKVAASQARFRSMFSGVLTAEG